MAIKQENKDSLQTKFYQHLEYFERRIDALHRRASRATVCGAVSQGLA